MSEPIKITQPKTQGYVQIGADMQNLPCQDTAYGANLIFGVETERGNGWHAKAEGFVDSSKILGAKIGAGYKFDLSKDGKYFIDADASISYKYDLNKQSIIYEDYSNSFHGDEKKANLGVKFGHNLPNKKGKITVGAEGGWRSDTNPDVTLTSEQVSTFGDGVIYCKSERTIKNHKSSLYVSPAVGAEYNISKNLSVKADLSLNEANAGLRFTF